MLAPIEDILSDLRAGKMVILVDDEDRENEGDLIMAAEKVTPEAINFMTRHTPGYLCLALTSADCERLNLHPQTGLNTSLRGTAMAVSIDGHPKHGVGTGISASDRARTVRIAVDPSCGPEDLVRPGHMVPLRARDGGVLVRTGQTEGSVDLMRLAGMRPAAVISEVCKEDGEMARRPELEQFAARHGLRIGSVEQIVQYRLERERLVQRLEPRGGTPISTDYGQFNLIAFRSLVDPLPHLALCVGGVGNLDAAGHVIESAAPTLVRMHRRNLLGDLFGESSNPTIRSLAGSLRVIQSAGRGALVYLRPQESGDDIFSRLHSVLPLDFDTDVNRPDLLSPFGVAAKAVPMDRRDLGVGTQILRDLGLTKIRLLSANPTRYHNLAAFGLEIVERVGIS